MIPHAPVFIDTISSLFPISLHNLFFVYECAFARFYLLHGGLTLYIRKPHIDKEARYRVTKLGVCKLAAIALSEH